MGTTGRIIILLLLSCCMCVNAQDTKGGGFNDFKKEIDSLFHSKKEADRRAYRKFRDEVNAKYAELLEEAWTTSESEPAVPMPQQEPIFPVQPVAPDSVNSYTLVTEPMPYKFVITLPEPIQQPKPVVPIFEVPDLDTEWFDFEFYGTKCQVRLDDRHRFAFSSIDERAISAQWKKCSGELYDNLIRDCLTLRMKMNLCDYAYLQMLDVLCDEFLGEDTNESVFLMAYLYCQSGYKMRLAKDKDNSRLILLYSSRHILFGRPKYNNEYFTYDPSDVAYSFCNISFENEQPLSFVINSAPTFADSFSAERKIESRRYINMSFTIAENENLINFYNSYPPSRLSDNAMTQWAIYANTPVSETVKKNLYERMKESLEGLSPYDAVSYLLNWAQTGFEYKVDGDVWGEERIFFMEETLYYPYSDCEDRSILFARMVRDLLGLDVLLLRYPAHLSTAIAIPGEVSGTYCEHEGKNYFVCDPTCVNGPVGYLHPSYRGSDPTIIKLD